MSFYFRWESVGKITFNALMLDVGVLDSSVLVHEGDICCFVLTFFTLSQRIFLDLVLVGTVCCGQCIRNGFLAEKKS